MQDGGVGTPHQTVSSYGATGRAGRPSCRRARPRRGSPCRAPRFHCPGPTRSRRSSGRPRP
ncbi:hypothetical protein DLE60_33000 [Micromonospora globispora]|nr:hypothetical protein DLE60_33000 [Micromonospora globispora]